jgi:hypothetical protein
MNDEALKKMLDFLSRFHIDISFKKMYISQT